MTARDFASTAFVAVAVACAVISTGILVRRELSTGSTAAVRTAVKIDHWQQYADVGHRMGPVDAPVTILEFADFECPVCRHFTLGALSAIRAQYGAKVAVVFRHWPLSYHRFAYPAARAAECAADQGRFSQFHDLLYTDQDSLGLKSFMSYATDAGVRDTAVFAKCLNDPATAAAIDRDSAAARQIGGNGTPTIVINGLRLAGAPDSATLAKYVDQALHASR